MSERTDSASFNVNIAFVFLSSSCKGHCYENSIYVFLFWELHDLSPNVHIRVSVSDLYIPRISPQIFLQQNRHTEFWKYINLAQIYECRTGRQNIVILFWKLTVSFLGIHTVNGNQTFILDSHRPFICGVVEGDMLHLVSITRLLITFLFRFESMTE
jgi:hypothetical protein